MNSTTDTPKQPPKIIRILRKLWVEIRRYTQLREDTDYEATIDSISKSVEFKGVNTWILFFAVIIASVGLNTNSTAVIIGAMLISPLMGPINGVGLSIGISDEELLRKSLKNLLIMVGISLLASTLYFLISPLSEARSELLARTRPTIFDVFIAFFGGLAGIVATSRKTQSLTVISGVAIATALMPPLCTAGFGLATGQIWYFLGAFYLFFINSFFIALATALMVLFLHFPKKKYINEKLTKNAQHIIVFFTIIMVVPSIFLAGDVIRETNFNNQSLKFINEIQEKEMFQNIQIIKSDREYHYKNQTITLSLMGDPLSNEQIQRLQDELQNKYGLEKTKLIIKQTGISVDITKQNEIIENIINKKDEEILRKDSTITELQSKLSKVQQEEILSLQLTREAYTQYPNLTDFAITDMTRYNTKSLDKETISVVYLKWKDDNHENDEKNLVKWLKVRLGVETLEVIH